MESLTFYAAFAGTIVSVATLLALAVHEYDPEHHQTLSDIVAYNQDNVRYFRLVSWFCGPMITITMLFYIAPRITGTVFVQALWTLLCLCELLLAVIPTDAGVKGRIHKVFAYIMGAGMLLTALIFVKVLAGGYSDAEYMLAIAMAALGTLMIIHKKKFLFYELPYIFLSHVSILVAAIALR